MNNRAFTGNHAWRERSSHGAAGFFCVLLALGFLAAGAFPARAERALRCDVCGKEISDRYTVYDLEGRKVTVCAACERSAPRCAMCRVPLRSDHPRVAGEQLCRRCAREAKTCDLCGHLLRGSYTVFALPDGGGEQKVCAACARIAAKCAACGIPLKPGTEHRDGGRILCAPCDSRLPACEACGNRIIGSSFAIAFRPGQFCESCWRTRPACSMCAAPVGNSLQVLDDGRRLCGQCAPTATLDLEKTARVLAQIQPFLEKKFGSPLKAKVNLRLAGPQELGLADADLDASHTHREDPADGALAAEATPAALSSSEVMRGRSEKELGKFIRQGDKFEIRILSGQPEAWLWETLAHEFAHAWQSEKNPRLTDSAWAEGFAQWAAELVLEWRQDQRSLDRLRTRTDFYGQAWRLVHRIEILRGEEAVVPYILALKTDE